MNTTEYPIKGPHWTTRFLWWCAGADAHFLKLSPMQDRVKYAGIGGIILCTGLLAGVSGSFAFYTIFGPKGDALDASLKASIGIQIGTALFAIVWGLIIFNLDRFIVSSTGKGDGTDNVTWKEIKQAIPRIIIALVLGFAISAPLEIKILESEINSELSIFQNKYAQDLNMQSDTMFNQKKADLENKKAEYESKLAKYETELKVYSVQVDDLVARQQTEMQDKRAYGFGPVAKKMQTDIETKRTERDKFIQNKLGDVSAWRKQLEVINTQINNLSDDLRKEYKANEEKSHGYDGLLKRIEISHEKGGVVPWVILLVFLCIEMGPIFFKMMMTKGVYDFMVENNNHKAQVENGVYREDFVYEGKDGVIHMEKWRYLDVESAKLEKQKKIAEQDKINELIIKEWSDITINDIKNDPTKYFHNEDRDSAAQNG